VGGWAPLSFTRTLLGVVTSRDTCVQCVRSTNRTRLSRSEEGSSVSAKPQSACSDLTFVLNYLKFFQNFQNCLLPAWVIIAAGIIDDGKLKHETQEVLQRSLFGICLWNRKIRQDCKLKRACDFVINFNSCPLFDRPRTMCAQQATIRTI
jgi:hypothetical protein